MHACCRAWPSKRGVAKPGGDRASLRSHPAALCKLQRDGPRDAMHNRIHAAPWYMLQPVTLLCIPCMQQRPLEVTAPGCCRWLLLLASAPSSCDPGASRAAAKPEQAASPPVRSSPQ